MKGLTGRKRWLFLLSLSIASRLSAQDSLRLTLDHALETAFKSNKEIAVAKLDEESAYARYKQTDAVFLPRINVGYTAMTTDNPLNAFGFRLQQRSVLQSDFNPELMNHPSGTRDFSLRIELQQPILNADKLHLRKSGYRLTEAYALTAQRTREHLAFEVQKAYIQLQLAYNAFDVMTETVKTINAVYLTSTHRYEKGFIQKSDVLLVQVQVATVKSKLLEAENNIKNASDYLAFLMGENTGSIFIPESLDLQPKDDSFIDPGTVGNRADLQAMEKMVEAHDFQIRSEKRKFLPKLNAFGNYQWNDNEALGFGAESYLAGLQLSWNIFNGMETRHAITHSRTERDKLAKQFEIRKDQSQLELDKAIRNANVIRHTVEQQDIAVQHASEAFRISRNRYEQGLVSTNDMLQAQTTLSQQKLTKAQAIAEFNTTMAYLDLLTTSHK